MKPNRLNIFNKFAGHCAYCGIELDLCNMHIDHQVPQVSSRDDVHTEKNYFPACPICNGWKHSDNLESFRRSIQQQVRKCRDYSRNFRMAERYGLVREVEKPIVFYFETLL
jgi:5-methylcytosine-specific restriction endonuclease McrA